MTRGILDGLAGPSRWSIDPSSIVWAAIGLAVITAMIVWVYRSMQHPRLYLSPNAETGEPQASWQSLVRYLVLLPIVLAVWLFVIILIMTVAANDRTAEQIALAAAAVVGAARVLAHTSPEGSHELGKTIPLAVLSIIILGGTPDGNSWADIINDIDKNGDALDGAYVTLLILDVVLTGLWYWRVRAQWREERPTSVITRLVTWMKPGLAVFRNVRDFGKTKESKAKPYGDMTAGGVGGGH